MGLESARLIGGRCRIFRRELRLVIVAARLMLIVRHSSARCSTGGNLVKGKSATVAGLVGSGWGRTAWRRIGLCGIVDVNYIRRRMNRRLRRGTFWRNPMQSVERPPESRHRYRGSAGAIAGSGRWAGAVTARGGLPSGIGLHGTELGGAPVEARRAQRALRTLRRRDLGQVAHLLNGDDADDEQKTRSRQSDPREQGIWTSEAGMANLLGAANFFPAVPILHVGCPDLPQPRARQNRRNPPQASRPLAPFASARPCSCSHTGRDGLRCRVGWRFRRDWQWPRSPFASSTGRRKPPSSPASAGKSARPPIH